MNPAVTSDVLARSGDLARAISHHEDRDDQRKASAAVVHPLDRQTPRTHEGHGP